MAVRRAGTCGVGASRAGAGGGGRQAPRELPGGPLRGRAQESVVGIRRTADEIQRAPARLIEPYGVTDQQYNVLRILRGSHPGALNTLEIGEGLIERQPNVTRLLDRLEAKGRVRRKRCTDDRRVVHCWISDAGLELLAELDDPVARAIDDLLHDLAEEEQRQLVSLLRRVRGRRRGDARAVSPISPGTTAKGADHGNG